MSGTPFQELLDAVASYYGTGSDQWVEIAQYGLKADNCAEILSQIPNVSTTVAKNGNILSYTVDNVASVASQGASSAINSNTQTALMTQTAPINVPANMAVDGTGQVIAESGLKTVSTGSTVIGTLGKVAVGVGAVMTGAQMGAKISKLLYEVDPDFWDTNGMSARNPETWDSICSTQGGKDVFNAIFAIDDTNGTTQAYLPQETVALITQYLVAEGVFDLEEIYTYSDDNPTFTSVDPIYAVEVPYSYNAQSAQIYRDGLTIGYDTDGYVMKAVHVSGNYQNPIYLTVYNYNDSNYILTTSKSNYGTVRIGHFDGETEKRRDEIPLQRDYTINSNNFSISTGTPFNGSSIIGGVSAQQTTDEATNRKYLGYTILYGELTIETEGGVDGITKQEGSSIVTPTGITEDMTTAQVLAVLASLYPAMFNNAITNDVVQPDGSVITYTYLPVPIPDEISINDTTGAVEPTGGTDLQQDADPISDTSPQSIIDTLLEMITSTDPYSPTESTPTTPTTYPDTGTGDTPAIVTPTGSASALYSIYNPTQSELNSFGAWLWSNDFVEQLKKIFNDPMQSIIGLHKIFATPATSGTGTIKVGYLNSGVSSKLVSNQYTEVDCGTINLIEYFGNVLDYLNTDVYCYLPFIGIVPLNVSDVMRGEINIKYKIDVLTGACLCSINVKRDLSGGQLYTYSGNCAVQYPLSSGSYMGIVSSALSIAGSVVGSIASGGALLPVALGVSASAISNAKTKVEMSGNITGSSGAMGIKKPYLIIRRPQTKIADNFETFHGVSNNKTATLSTYTGYTRVKYVHLENIPATDNELTEIENILKEGVLI